MKSFFGRHPILRQTLLWCLPALFFGLALRGLLLAYSPYAYWGADSDSYIGFTHSLLDNGKWDLHEKRRYFYPLFLCPVMLLPGAALQWLAWLQHAFGLATVVAFGYVIRKWLAGWRLWIVPLTLLYAGMPMLLWYEHELLGETFFFSFAVWSMAGWAAWHGAQTRQRALVLWWTFFIPFALMMTTKPAGRFFWPGLVVALLLARGWRTLQWKQGAALALLFGVTMTMGLSKQGAWLLYNSSFPLTRLDTPLHAEYKAEVADLVTDARQRIQLYYREEASNGIKRFLRNPGDQTERPLWAALAEDRKLQTRIYEDLAREAILHRPDLFLRIALARMLDSANPGDFRSRRFDPAYFSDRLEDSYPNILRKKGLAERLFGLPKGEEPSLETVRQWVNPGTAPAAVDLLSRYVDGYNENLVLCELPGKHNDIPGFRLRLAGWLAAAGAVLALAVRRYRATVGAWGFMMASYLFGVYLVGSTNPRFFGPVWPLILLLVVVPPDGLYTTVVSCLTRPIRKSEKSVAKDDTLVGS